MNAIFNANPAQVEILQHPARIKVAVCGRRWGKTILMLLAMAVTALEYPGCRIWFIANDYAHAMAQMRAMKRSPDFMKLVRHCYAQFPPRFELKNGSEICFRSADRPDLLLGAGLRLIAYDEAARGTKDLFYRVLMPMIADTRGTIITGSTYNGRNWFYDLAELGKNWSEDNPDAMVKTWIYPTHTGYEFQSDEGQQELKRLKANTDPMTWKQEYECEPLALIDAVFAHVDQCVSKKPANVPQHGRRYVLAQDIGRVVDASGIVVMDLDTGEIVCAHGYPLGMRHDEQAKRTRQTAEDWNNALVVLDTTGGATGGRNESAIKDYAKIITSFMPIVWTVDTKRNMVNRLALDFETKKLSIPEEFKELISQAKLYRYKFSESAMQPTFFGRPDDQIAALMMCAWAREKGWGPMVGGYKGML